MKARRMFIGLTFALNILLGNLCLLNISYAASIAPAGDLEPFSREVYGCPWIVMNKEFTPVHPVESPCATGQCIAKPKPQTSSLIAATHLIIPPALPVTFTTDIEFIPVWQPALPRPPESPPDPAHIRTIVMRR